jgi:ribonuclease R
LKITKPDKPPQYNLSIPSRDMLLAILKDTGKPINSKEIATLCKMPSQEHRKAIRKRLKAMVRDGQIIRNRRGGYGLVNKMDLISGQVIGNTDGYGFLKPDAGGEDIYLPAKVMRSLLNGDRAVIRVSGKNRRGKPEGSLVEVLERANERIVGRYYKEKNIGFVIPDNKRLHQDIFIPVGSEKKAKHGQYVVVRLTRQPDKHTQPVGKVIEIIGDQISSGIATDVAIRAYEIPHVWPKDLNNEIRALKADKIKIPKDRKDLRDKPFVTIDGEDARDFDDAVYCEKKADNWSLYVAIADVSHYVRPDTALDKEAFVRGTSVYFPDRVIPMLPEILSNELCSLKPDVDRLAMVCVMTVNPRGKVMDYRFMKAVIRSSARMTYTSVAAAVVDKDKALRKRYQHLTADLDNLYSLYKTMHKARISLGILDFDTVESRIIFDEQGSIESIEAMVRNDAHRLIEEFMLAANISAAKTLVKNKLPALFRIHDCPKQDKLVNLREFLKAFSLSLGGGDTPTAKDYAKLINKIQGRPEAHLIQTVLLRSLPLAYYGEVNLGHFGLAFEAYTHFTSPIRRFPDLLVHRAIKAILKSRKDLYPYNNDVMHEYGAHCSSTERRAEEASRDVVQRLKCEYMKDRIGEKFEGTITGVTGFGLFVELNEVYVEGLIHVTSLPADYYHHDPVHHLLRGERTGRTYRLANQIKVRLIRVDTIENKIDFELVK